MPKVQSPRISPIVLKYSHIVVELGLLWLDYGSPTIPTITNKTGNTNIRLPLLFYHNVVFLNAGNWYGKIYFCLLRLFLAFGLALFLSAK